LDVINGDPTSGTPVWLYWCNWSVAQQWSYDREAQTITNTAFGKCLQVRPNIIHFASPPIDIVLDNRGRGAIAEISDCVSPPPTRQRWSYDPEGGVIHSAEGTVLDIQGANVVPQNPVFIWDYNGGIAQQWHAD
jgi:hypothetical protein